MAEKFALSTDDVLDAMLWTNYLAYKRLNASEYAEGLFHGSMQMYGYVVKMEEEPIMNALAAQYQRENKSS